MIANVDHGDTTILNCQTWLAQNYERADIVAELVRQCGLPKRTFDRRFRAATGYSPLAYIQALRIEEAKQLLETGAAAIEAVAREVGYEDLASIRRLFRRLAGMAPGDYRRKFQVPTYLTRAGHRRARARGKPRKPPRRGGARAASCGPRANAAPRSAGTRTSPAVAAATLAPSRASLAARASTYSPKYFKAIWSPSSYIF